MRLKTSLRTKLMDAPDYPYAVEVADPNSDRGWGREALCKTVDEARLKAGVKRALAQKQYRIWDRCAAREVDG